MMPCRGSVSIAQAPSAAEPPDVPLSRKQALHGSKTVGATTLSDYPAVLSQNIEHTHEPIWRSHVPVTSRFLTLCLRLTI
jgi:hypothetical protein